MESMAKIVSIPDNATDIFASVEQLGQGEKIFVILPGGPGLPAKTMRFEAELLAQFGIVYLIDPPGVGRSSSPPSEFDYSPASHAEWYLAVLSSLGIAQFNVLGASFGGMVAIAMAALAPEKLLAGVCVSTRVIGVELDDTDAELHMKRTLQRHAASVWYDAAMDTFDNWQALVAQAQTTAEIKDMNRAILPLYAAHPDKPATWNKIQRLADECDFDVLATKAWEDGLYQSFDLRPSLQKVTAKFLIIGGDSDWMTSPAAHRHIASQIPHAKLDIIPDCGHLVALEQPEAFTNSVRAFFQ